MEAIVESETKILSLDDRKKVEKRSRPPLDLLEEARQIYCINLQARLKSIDNVLQNIVNCQDLKTDYPSDREFPQDLQEHLDFIVQQTKRIEQITHRFSKQVYEYK